MKKLEFKEGAITPFWLKDLEYMQEGFEEVIKSVIEGLSLGRKNILITGCKISYNNSKVSMTDGWCYYAGEVLPVKALPETEYTGSNPKIKFTRKSVYDASGSRTALKETEHVTVDVYRTDYLEPSLVPSTGTVPSYALAIGKDAWDLGTRIANMNRIKDSGIVIIELDDTVPTIKGYIQYRQIGGVVQLYGRVGASGFTGFITDRIPAPATRMVVDTGKGNLIMDSDGLRVQSLTEPINLDGITYLSDPIYEPVADGHYQPSLDNPEYNEEGIVSGGIS